MATTTTTITSQYGTGYGWTSSTSGDSYHWYLGGSSRYRSRIIFTTPSSGVSSISKVTFGFKSDETSITPMYVRAFLSATNISSSDADVIASNASTILATSYLYKDKNKTTRQTSYTTSVSSMYYFVFNATLAANTTYYIYILPYYNNYAESTANIGSTAYTDTWIRSRAQSGYYELETTYSAPVYYTTVDKNGGTGGSNSGTQTSGTTGTLTNPTRTGYTFAGWKLLNDNSNGTCILTNTSGSTWTYKMGVHKTYPNTSATSASQSICTLQAQWTPVVRRVTFHVNIPNIGYYVSEDFTYGVANQRFGYNTNGTGKYNPMNAADVGFGAWSRGGYKMLGWSESSTATAMTYSTYSGVADSWILYTPNPIHLYSVWELKTYTLSFNLNGGTCNDTDISGGVTVTYSKTSYWDISWGLPSREGYVFRGFYDSSGNQLYDSAGHSVAGTYWNSSHAWIYDGNVTAIAKWDEIVTAPAQSGTNRYNGGSSVSATWNSNYNSSKMTIGGTYATTGAPGTYTATFTPKSGYCWSDGTTSAKSVNWTLSNGTITVTKVPYSAAYDGSAHKASIKTNIAGCTVKSGTASGTYGTSDSTNTIANTAVALGATTRTNAGTTTVYYQVSKTYYDTVSDSTTITISAINPTVTFDSWTKTYTAAAQNYTGKASVAGVLYMTWNGTTLTSANYSTSAQKNVSLAANTTSTIDSDTNAGTWTYKFYFVPTDATNYNAITPTSQTMIMNQVALGAIAKPSNATFNNSAQSPTPAVTATVNSATKTLTKDTDYTLSYSNNTNVGTATVTATGKGNYKGTVSNTWSITILSLTVPTLNANPTYNGTTSVSPTFNNYNSTYMTVSGNTTTGAIAAKTATFTLKSTAGTNYKWADGTVTNKTVSWQAQKRAITVTANSKTQATYNGSAVTDNGGSITSGSLGTGDTGTITATGSQTNVGSSSNVPSITIKNASGTNMNSNYTITLTNGTLKVTNKADQAAPTSVSGQTVSFHNTATASASGGGGHGALTWTNGSTRTAVGEQTTKAYWAGDGNYNASPQTTAVTLKVTKATDAGVTVTNTNRTYTGSAQVITTLSNAHGVSAYGVAETATNVTTAPTSWGTSNISKTNAGTYRIWYYWTADSNHSESNQSATYTDVVVSKRSITKPSNGASRTYTGSALSNNITTPSYTSIVATSSTTSATNVGTYTVTYSINDTANNQWNDNTITNKTATWAITAVSLGGIGSVSSATYTGSAQTPTPSVTATVASASKTLTKDTDYTLSYSSNTNVGTATVTATGKGNYTGTKSTTWSITRAATATASVANKTYNGSAQTATSGSYVNWSGTTSATNVTFSSGTTVGTYSCSATPDGNHAWPDGTYAAKSFTWTMNQYNLSGATITLSATTHTFSGSYLDPTPTVKALSATLTKDTHYTVSYTHSTPSTTAGTATSQTATITAKAGTNYTGSKTANWTETRATYAVSYNANGHGTAPSSQTKVYGVDLTLRASMGTISESNVTGYTVSYNANGGTSTPSSSTSTRTPKYAQASWNTASGGGGTSYAFSATYTGNAALTLYAIWNGVTYTNNAITLASAIAKSNTTANVSITQTYNGNGGSTPTAVSKNGVNTTTYTFSKWAAGSTSGTQYAASSSYTPSAAVTMYATWGSSTSRTSNPEFSAPTTPTRDGYTFAGWFTAASGGTQLTFPRTISASETIYAHWTKNPVKVRVGTEWKNGYAYVYTGGQWKPAIVYVRGASAWKPTK